MPMEKNKLRRTRSLRLSEVFHFDLKAVLNVCQLTCIIFFFVFVFFLFLYTYLLDFLSIFLFN